MKIDGELFVTVEDISDALEIEIELKENHIIFKEDDIELKLNLGTPYIYRDKYIIEVMGNKPVEKK